MKPFAIQNRGRHSEEVTEEFVNVEEESTCYKVNVDLFSLCRICGRVHNHHVVSIYDDDGVELQLEEKINTYLPITVSMNDQLPLHVCYSCIEKLDIVHEYIVACIDADQRFTNYLETKDINVLVPDAESFAGEQELVETEYVPVTEPSLDIQQLEDLNQREEGIVELNPEETQEVSEDTNKLKKVVVLKLVHSKDKNLLSSVRIDQALEYLKNKKRTLGMPGDINLISSTATDSVLSGVHTMSTVSEKDDCSVNGITTKTGMNIVPEKLVNSFPDSNDQQNNSAVMIKCPINNFDVKMSNGQTMYQAESKLVARSISHSRFTQITDSEAKVTAFQKSKEGRNSHETEMSIKLPSVRLTKALDYLKSKRLMLGMQGYSISSKALASKTALCGISNTLVPDKNDNFCSVVKVTDNDKVNNCPEQLINLPPEIQNTNSGLIKYAGNKTDVEMDTSIESLQQAGTELVAGFSSNSPFKHLNAETSYITTSEADGISLQNTNEVYDASNDTEMDEKIEEASITPFCEEATREEEVITSESPKLESQISQVLGGVVDSGTRMRIIEAVQSIVSNDKKSVVQPNVLDSVSCNNCGCIMTSEDMTTHTCSKYLKPGPVEFTCKICKRKFKDMYKYTIHKQTHFKGSTFECPKCHKKFARKCSLQLHLMSHVSVKPHQCKFCSRNFLHRGSLFIHVACVHSNEKSWLCDKCGEKFTNRFTLNNHVRTHQDESPVEQYQCEFCDKSFQSEIVLSEHMGSHSEEQPYNCQQCNKCFNSEEKLKYHEAIHSNARPYQCSICSISFIRKGNLTKHYKTHASEKIVTCRICKATFPSVAGLLNHRKSHTIDEINQIRIPLNVEGETQTNPLESYKCTLCNKFLSSKLSLSLHMRVHTGEKPFQCEVCNKRFTQKPALTYHMRLHTGERPHACQFCGKGFNSKVGKESHERIHTGERPYKCGQCGVGFRCSANLRQHSWIHTDNRPFVCEVCQKLFRRREALQVHMRIHTGERPYSCPICGRSFTQKGDMLKHTRSHSKKNERMTGIACLNCGQVFSQKKYYKMHVEKCNMLKDKMAILKDGDQEILVSEQTQYVELKEEVLDIKNEELQEINTVTLTSDDIIITLPEITIVTDDIQGYEVEYQ